MFIYHEPARLGDTESEVSDASWAAFGRALLDEDHVEPDGHCACGCWQGVCSVRLIARQHGIPVSPVAC